MRKLTTTFLFTCISFFAAADYWTQLANFPAQGRQLASGFSIGNKGYVTCGEGGTYFNDLWEYDPVTNQWTQLASLPGAGRYGAVVFTINDKGYVGTGAYPLMDDLWEYDPLTNTWAQKASITGARGFAVGFAIGSKGYIGCGMGASDFWEWDQLTNTWSQKSSCPINRVQGVGFAVGSKGYFSTGDYLNDLWEYDPATNTWLQKASLPAPGRVDATAFVICEKGYLGSGGDGPLMDDFWEYDPVTDQWVQKAFTPGGLRDDCPSFSIGQKGYFGLGDNGVYQVDFWEYTPDPCVSLPPIAAFSAPNHICPGTCTDFNNLSSYAVSYVWIFPGGSPSISTDENPTSICYNTPGVYPVTLIAANATDTDTLVLNNYMTVYPSPAAQGILQNGDTLFANAGAVSYQWYHDGNIISGATEYFYIASEGGSYNVVATDNNGCEVEAVIFDVVAGISQLAVGNGQLAIFPNPVQETLTITGIFPIGISMEISVYNAVGEKMFSAVDWELRTVNCQLLPSGMYWIELLSDDKKIYGRFVKK
jgi:PKD repeat protein/N-acetylneuraminic acid mutarotase